MTDTTDSRVDKRKVTMTAVVARGTYPSHDEDGNPHPQAGQPILELHQMVDYVREEALEAYLALVQSAKTHWQTVEVAEGYDAGPGGYDGQTKYDHRLDHPLAGQTIPATPGSSTATALAVNLERSKNEQAAAAAGQAV